MLAEKTGPRYDGRPWPGPGGEIDVPDEEGAGLCAQGDAAPVAQPDADVEARAAESPAEAPEPPGVSKPGVNAPKAAWLEYALAQGLPEDEAAAMSKADLIAALG
jgi:hypothetical protein